MPLVVGFKFLSLCLYGIRELASATSWTSSLTSTVPQPACQWPPPPPRPPLLSPSTSWRQRPRPYPPPAPGRCSSARPPPSLLLPRLHLARLGSHWSRYIKRLCSHWLDLSYAIKTQLNTPKARWHKGGFDARKGSIIESSLDTFLVIKRNK